MTTYSVLKRLIAMMAQRSTGARRDVACAVSIELINVALGVAAPALLKLSIDHLSNETTAPGPVIFFIAGFVIAWAGTNATAAAKLVFMPLIDDPLLDEPLTSPALPALSHTEDVFEDFISTRLSLKDHPVRLVRGLAGRNLTLNNELRNIAENRTVTLLGAVITRQRPATASGVVFITLEDETGSANLIVWKNTFEKYRSQVMQGRLLKVRGKVQREGRVIHVIAEHIEDYSYLFDELGEADSAIDMTWSTADEVKKQIPDARQTSRFKKKPQPAPAMHPRQQAKRLFQSRDFH